jgi:hypothetical protein
MMGFGGSGGRVPMPFNQRQGRGMGERGSGAVAKREGNPSARACSTWWSCGGGEGGGGSGAQRRPDTDGDRRHESRRSRGGRREGLPVGRPAGCGLAGGGKGGYERWAPARERKERKRKQMQFKFEIDISNLFKLDSIPTGSPRT